MISTSTSLLDVIRHLHLSLRLAIREIGYSPTAGDAICMISSEDSPYQSRESRSIQDVD